jgi:ACS family tartrate transporter-like MFS transporter
MVGLFFFCALTCNYAYQFSAPAMLLGATGWTVTHVGYLVAGFGVAGALAMLLNGAHSDRHRERRMHAVVPCVLMAAAFLTASYSGWGWLTAAALGISYVAFTAMQGPALAVPTEFLAGRAAAAGIAAMNTITMFSGFVGPAWMGVMKDATGSYMAGLRGLVVPSLLAGAFMWALTKSLERKAMVVGGLGEESA